MRETERDRGRDRGRDRDRDREGQAGRQAGRDGHTRSWWVDKGKDSGLNYLDNQASNKHTTCNNGRPLFS